MSFNEILKFNNAFDQTQVIAGPFQLSSALSFTGANGLFNSQTSQKGFLYADVDCVTLKPENLDSIEYQGKGESHLTRSIITCPENQFVKSFKNRYLNRGWLFSEQ